jgi:hypothetical protein
MGDEEGTNDRQTDMHKVGVRCGGCLGGDAQLTHCLFLLIFSFTLLLFSIFIISGLTPLQFFKTLLLKSSFLFFKVSFLRLALSHVLSLAFLKSQPSDLQTNNSGPIIQQQSPHKLPTNSINPSLAIPF